MYLEQWTGWGRTHGGVGGGGICPPFFGVCDSLVLARVSEHNMSPVESLYIS